MRQVFLGTPWVHSQTLLPLVDLFNKEGRWLRLSAGASIFNGGDRGEVALVLSGLGAYSFPDCHGKPHIFALLPPLRLMGDVDSFTSSSVNVVDYALRAMELRMISREKFLYHLDANPELLKAHERVVISDHESDMEGMVANYTMSLPQRMMALFESLVSNYPVVYQNEWVQLPVRLTTVEISRIVAGARPSVSCILNDWQRHGVVRLEDKGAYVLAARLKGFDWLSHGASPSVGVRRKRQPVH